MRYWSIGSPAPVQLEQMFRSPCLERKLAPTKSKTVRRVVCRGEVELANKSYESRGEEGRGDRLVAVGKLKKGSSRLVGTKLK